jgi:hypothetical protein
MTETASEALAIIGGAGQRIDALSMGIQGAFVPAQTTQRGSRRALFAADVVAMRHGLAPEALRPGDAEIGEYGSSSKGG